MGWPLLRTATAALLSGVPMPFMINGDVYYERANLSRGDFYRLLSENAEASMSQPTVACAVKSDA